MLSLMHVLNLDMDPYLWLTKLNKHRVSSSSTIVYFAVLVIFIVLDDEHTS